MHTTMLVLVILLVLSVLLNFLQVLINSSYSTTSVEKFIKIRKKFFIKHIEEQLRSGSNKLVLSNDLVETDILTSVLKEYSDKGFKYSIEPHGNYMTNIYFSVRSEYL
jgi:hypothetical protein